MKLLKGLHIGYIRQPWKCPACGDYFEVPNTNHSCPERRHFKDRKRAFRNGIGIGLFVGLFVFTVLILMFQRNLLSLYADEIAFMKSHMEYIDNVNKVVLNAHGYRWGDDEEPPRMMGR